MNVAQIGGEQRNSKIEKADDGKKKTKSFAGAKVQVCENANAVFICDTLPW